MCEQPVVLGACLLDKAKQGLIEGLTCVELAQESDMLGGEYEQEQLAVLAFFAVAVDIGWQVVDEPAQIIHVYFLDVVCFAIKCFIMPFVKLHDEQQDDNDGKQQG